MAATASLTAHRDDPRTLVVVFLRGAADGLTLVAPLEDDHYHRARPRLAVKKSDAVPLDGFFGLHPNLRPLEAAWKEGELAILHGAGVEDESRSHFEAQDFMEHGGPVAGGWLGRFLRHRGPAAGPLDAVALSPTLPEMLSGAPSVAAIQSIAEFGLGREVQPAFPRELERLYARETGPLGTALREAATNTFTALRRIEALDAHAAPEHGASYSTNDDFAQGLRQIALLIKADLGLAAATVDLGNWDSHFTQKTLIEPLMSRLANGLAAFRQDLGPRLATTTVVIMTEFGRRVAENSAFGTDHGRGGAMFVLGGGVHGGRVLGGWPGLKKELLDGPGDLPVWNNYRNVLAPILTRHGATAQSLPEIFPEFALQPVDLYS
jgi:uncharacterized protein (DUF1501 family)